MPRSVARFKRIGEWQSVNEETVCDSIGETYQVITEASDTMEVATGKVFQQGRWRVRVKSRQGIERPRTRSYSGEIREELANMRVAEITNILTSRHKPRVLQRSLTHKGDTTKMMSRENNGTRRS